MINAPNDLVMTVLDMFANVTSQSDRIDGHSAVGAVHILTMRYSYDEVISKNLTIHVERLTLVSRAENYTDLATGVYLRTWVKGLVLTVRNSSMLLTSTHFGSAVQFALSIEDGVVTVSQCNITMYGLPTPDHNTQPVYVVSIDFIKRLWNTEVTVEDINATILLRGRGRAEFAETATILTGALMLYAGSESSSTFNSSLWLRRARVSIPLFDATVRISAALIVEKVYRMQNFTLVADEVTMTSNTQPGKSIFVVTVSSLVIFQDSPITDGMHVGIRNSSLTVNAYCNIVGTPECVVTPLVWNNVTSVRSTVSIADTNCTLRGQGYFATIAVAVSTDSSPLTSLVIERLNATIQLTLLRAIDIWPRKTRGSGSVGVVVVHAALPSDEPFSITLRESTVTMILNGTGSILSCSTILLSESTLTNVVVTATNVTTTTRAQFGTTIQMQVPFVLVFDNSVVNQSRLELTAVRVVVMADRRLQVSCLVMAGSSPQVIPGVLRDSVVVVSASDFDRASETWALSTGVLLPLALVIAGPGDVNNSYTFSRITIPPYLVFGLRGALDTWSGKGAVALEGCRIDDSQAGYFGLTASAVLWTCARRAELGAAAGGTGVPADAVADGGVDGESVDGGDAVRPAHPTADIAGREEGNGGDADRRGGDGDRDRGACARWGDEHAAAPFEDERGHLVGRRL